MARGLNAVVVDVVESFRSKKAAAVLMVFLFEGIIKSDTKGEKISNLKIIPFTNNTFYLKMKGKSL